MKLVNLSKVINEIERFKGYLDEDMILRIKIAINRLPTIEAEPVKHGRWIECESENGIHFHKCSECGKRDMYQGTFTDWGGRGFSFYFKRKYCPHCGCKMDLDEVNDD